MKNNAIFAKKRMIVHQMCVKSGRFGKVSRILPEGIGVATINWASIFHHPMVAQTGKWSEYFTLSTSHFIGVNLREQRI